MIPRHLQIALVLLLAAVFGMGFYGLHLRRVAERNLRSTQDTRPVAPPVGGPPVNVALFVPDDRDGLLHERAAAVALPRDEGLRAREILRALVAECRDRSSTHPLAENADISEVFIVGDDTAVVDANAAFADGHRSGIMVEELTLAAMAQTLTANLPAVTRIKLLVDGKERETLAGHVDLMGLFATTSAAKYLASRPSPASR